jgi:hypothetical protein
MRDLVAEVPGMIIRKTTDKMNIAMGYGSYNL